MKSMAAAPQHLDSLIASLGRSALFAGMDASVLKAAAAQATLMQADADETLTRQGEKADAFYVMLDGRASALLKRADGREDSEIATLGPGDTFGEVALLLEESYGVTVKAVGRVVAARLPASFFQSMAAQLPGFGLVLAKAIGRRLQQAMGQVPLPQHPDDEATPGPELMSLLPLEFLRRHRVLPVQSSGSMLMLGFVDAPSTAVLESVRAGVPGSEIRAVRISAAFFERALAAPGAAPSGAPSEASAGEPMSLERMLRAMIAEGASDLHLSAGHRPRWRVDGVIAEIAGAAPLGKDSVFEVVGPLIDARWSEQFRETQDVDFAYSLDAGARFRVNMFRDANGAGAVFRHIPTKIPDLKTLGMPEVVTRFCSEPKGLVLVTGPTGSGKSTTLAAMVDLINSTRKEHVLTLEDPVEFVHASKLALVNQREIGSHSASFSRALRAALREDPDIVLVGEMRDLETVALAMETANTGHLVLATLHTSTAPMTVDRIVGMFPPDEQAQIRTTLADVLRGVICQTLCRRIGGGRVAALEIMVVNAAISNLIRESKTVQMTSIMQTGKAAGNQLLNDSLASLVKSGAVEREEALSKAVDKVDLEKRLGGGPS